MTLTRRALLSGLLASPLLTHQEAALAKARPIRVLRVRADERVETYAYGPHKQQLLDATYDPDAVGRPWVMLVHGGSWNYFPGRNVMGTATGAFRDAGFQVFSIDYRTSVEARWPAQSYDAAGALQWIKSNADQFGISPHRGGIYGFSAGAHVASFMAVAGAGEHRTNAFVGVSGPYDPYLLWQRAREVPERDIMDGAALAAERLIGSRPDENWAAWEAARAHKRLSAGDAPMMLFHAKDDPAVPWECSLRLDYYANSPVTFRLVPTGGHGQAIVWNNPVHRKQVIDFMKARTI